MRGTIYREYATDQCNQAWYTSSPVSHCVVFKRKHIGSRRTAKLYVALSDVQTVEAHEFWPRGISCRLWPRLGIKYCENGTAEERLGIRTILTLSLYNKKTSICLLSKMSKFINILKCLLWHIVVTLFSCTFSKNKLWCCNNNRT